MPLFTTPTWRLANGKPSRVAARSIFSRTLMLALLFHREACPMTSTGKEARSTHCRSPSQSPKCREASTTLKLAAKVMCSVPLNPLIVEARDGRSVFSIDGRHYLGSLLIHWQNAQNLSQSINWVSKAMSKAFCNPNSMSPGHSKHLKAQAVDQSFVCLQHDAMQITDPLRHSL